MQTEIKIYTEACSTGSSGSRFAYYEWPVPRTAVETYRWYPHPDNPRPTRS